MAGVLLWLILRIARSAVATAEIAVESGVSLRAQRFDGRARGDREAKRRRGPLYLLKVGCSHSVLNPQ